MAISLIGVSTLITRATGLAASSIVFSSASPRGADVIIAFGGGFNASTALMTIGPTAGGYTTLLTSSTIATGPRFGVWRKVTSDTPSTAVVQFSSGNSTVPTVYGAVILRGVASTAPEDATSLLASGAGTTPQSPAIVTNFPNTIVISVVGIMNSQPTMTAPSSYINSTSANVADVAAATLGFTCAVATRLVATTGTETPGAWTSTVSTSWIAASIAVRAYVNPTSTAVPVLSEPKAFQPFLAQ